VNVLVALDATEDERTRMLRVEVSDRGLGVAAEDHDRIFQKYQHAPPESGGGAGLGLHIGRGFARALAGDIDLLSAPGEGSTFTLRVPVRLLDTAEAAAAASQCSGGGCEASGASERDVPAPALFSRVEAHLAAGLPPPEKDPFAACSLQEMLLMMLTDANEIFCYTTPPGDDNCPRFAYVSPSVRKVLGWDPGELIGKGCSCLIHPGACLFRRARACRRPEEAPRVQTISTSTPLRRRCLPRRPLMTSPA
jgi:PAS domain-containing protein